MSVITIHGNSFETVYDNAENISTPVLCPDSKPTINNINLSGLKTVISQNPNNLWGEESLADFQDLLANEPSDKIFVTVGEIILSPHNNPDVYYLFKQQKNKNGKTYLFIEKLKMKKRARKSTPVKKPKTTKKSVQETLVKPSVQQTKQTPIKKESKKKVEDDSPINAECFFMMRMAEALMDYVKLTYPNDLKKYKKQNH